MKQPSTEELVLFLKTSEPHKLILRALPIQIPLSGDSYTSCHISTFFKQYAFIDLERWGLIELGMTFEVKHAVGYTTNAMAVARARWIITCLGEQYLAELDYDH
jgi:hypothetical protein